MPTVDRIEGERAILEIGGELVEVPVSSLPPGAREGTILVWAIGSEEDKKREAEARLERLRAKSPNDKEIDL